MDGNRRWADKKGLPRLIGHKEGVKTLKELVRYTGANGLKYLTVYAFSSENWNRSPDEVNYLFELFGSVVRDELEELTANNVRLRFLGKTDEMPPHLQRSFQEAVQRTSGNTGLCLQVAINYGSRLELTEAVRKLARQVQAGRLNPEDIDAELLSSCLYTGDLPDPDLIIRTGGEMRLSNYLLWQAAYAELYVTPVLWPDFTPAEFEKAVAEFARRDRRYGGD
jgi:undecaprenyl diphosphate synthase